MKNTSEEVVANWLVTDASNSKDVSVFRGLVRLIPDEGVRPLDHTNLSIASDNTTSARCFRMNNQDT